MNDITYPADLPITARREELLATIRDNQVVVVAGETGSGKSTQLPKMCLELGRGAEGKLIGHTQPRRIAARSVAARVAEELDTTVGELVGSTVRFDDRVSGDTRIQVMTDGILLAATQRDGDLRRYDTIIIDEAHERSLNIDFLLGYLTRLLPRRPDLKVIITSATIDTERFAEHFDAPVIEVSGRTYPVEMRYRPFGEEPDDERDQTDAICDAVTELWTEDEADTLVFLSGQREIHDAADALAALKLPDTEILPLYARLSAAEQQRIFARHDRRRIVLATNVAETSLTVPGIRSVVDVGTARISRFSRRLKVQRLPIEDVSKASADQRAGRCGRVAPGVCIRLYSEESYEERPDFTEPEILRTNLASVILQMAALRLGPVADFPFVEPPDTRAITDGVKLLEELSAFEQPSVRDRRGTRRSAESGLRGRGTEQHDLTELGKRLSRIPLDPRIGRMVLEAEREECVREVLIIASALTIQDPREYPSEKRGEATAAHRRFMDSGSDFLALLELWEYLRQERKERSGNAFRRMCRAEYLHYVRIREWQDLDRQLRKSVRDLGVKISSSPENNDAIHRSILSGLLSHIGMLEGEREEYLGARDARFLVTRDSALRRSRPPWLMVNELTETNRLWGRTAARIEPEWAEHLGEHLVKRSHGDARWDEQRGRAVCNERVTLYGLPVVAARTVPYAQVDREEARDLFILHGLLRGEIELPVLELADNRAALAEARSLAERTRRSDLIVGEHLLFDAYDSMLGRDVTSIGHFNRWLKRARRSEPDVLTVRPEDLLGDEETVIEVDRHDFPDFWPHGDVDVPLTYEFDPLSATDGVMAHLDVATINQIGGVGFDWQVPGFRIELVEALLRTLPKETRRALAPIAETAAMFAAGHGPGEGALLDLLAGEASDRSKIRVMPGDFRLSEVSRNLRMTFAVFGSDGALLAAGKDLGRLRRKVADEVRQTVAGTFDHLEHDHVTLEVLAELVAPSDCLPEQVTEGDVVGFPALVVEGDHTALRVLDDAHLAQREHRAGTRALMARRLSDPRKVIVRRLPNEASLALAGSAKGQLVAVLDDCIDAAIELLLPESTPRCVDDLRVIEQKVKNQAIDRAIEIGVLIARAMGRAAQIEERAGRHVSQALDASVIDLTAHLDRLVAPGLAMRAGAERLSDIDRYLDAAAHRVEHLAGHVGRDRDHMATVSGLAAEIDRSVSDPERRDELHWMLEEMRVGLFAQHLGTKGPASVKRIRAAMKNDHQS